MIGSTYLHVLMFLVSSLGAEKMPIDWSKPYRAVGVVTQFCHTLPGGKCLSNDDDTKGLPLPGASNDLKSVSWHVDMTNTLTGSLTVSSDNLRPYQYMAMSDDGMTETKVQMYKRQAFISGENQLERETVAPVVAAAGEWVFVENVFEDRKLVSKWRMSSETDDERLANLYLAGFLPNAWVLAVDTVAKQPLSLSAINDRGEGPVVVHQITEFQNFEIEVPTLTLEEAWSRMYRVYDTKPASKEASRRLRSGAGDFPPMVTGLEAEDAESRRWYSNHLDHDMDWMPESKGIPYATISSEESKRYFATAEIRRLTEVSFSLPQDCTDSNYCISASYEKEDKTKSQKFALHMAFKPESVTSMGLTVEFGLGLTNGSITHAHGEAKGCGVFMTASIKIVSLELILCADGMTTYDKGTDGSTFSAEIDASLKMVAKAWKFTAASAAVDGSLSSTLKTPQQYAKVDGSIGVSVDIAKHAGASVAFDIDCENVAGDLSVWNFKSHVVAGAYIRLGALKKNFEQTITLWNAGPKQF